MLKRLVSNLPFSPSLIEDVPFYISKYKQQYFIRLFGLILLILALVVQLLIAANPPQPSISSSPNDIIQGGFSSKTEAVLDCQNNIDDFSDILNHFSLDCSDLANGYTQTISLNSYPSTPYSLNRVPYGAADEVAININGQTYWLRPVSSSNQYLKVHQKILNIQSSVGQNFMILYNSADLLMSKLAYAELSPTDVCSDNCPNQSISVVNYSQNLLNANNSIAKPGDELIYTLSTTNPEQQAINNYVVQENVASLMSYSQITNTYGGNLASNYIISWPAQSILPGETLTDQLTAKVDNPIPSTPVSSSDPNYYNLSQTNVYGNTVTVNLPLNVKKLIELSSLRFPDVSPATSVIILLILIALMAYFQMRTKLAIKVLEAIKHDYNKDRG